MGVCLLALLARIRDEPGLKLFQLRSDRKRLRPDWRFSTSISAVGRMPARAPTERQFVMQIAASNDDETIAALDQMKRSVRMAFCGVMQSTRLPPMAALSLGGYGGRPALYRGGGRALRRQSLPLRLGSAQRGRSRSAPDLACACRQAASARRFPRAFIDRERQRKGLEIVLAPKSAARPEALIGERGGNRTHDPLIKSQMLYLLSYALALWPRRLAPRAYSLIRDGSTPISASRRAVRAARSLAKSSPAWCEERVSGDDDTSRNPFAAPIAA